MSKPKHSPRQRGAVKAIRAAEPTYVDKIAASYASEIDPLPRKRVDPVDEIMAVIDGHALSSPAVAKSASREFWRDIIGALDVRIDALGKDDE